MSSYYGSRSSSSSSSPDNYTCVGGTILLLARIDGLVVVFLVKDHTNFFTAPMETRERGESCATCAARAAEEELLFCVSPAAVGNPASFQSVLVPNLRNPHTYATLTHTMRCSLPAIATLLLGSRNTRPKFSNSEWLGPGAIVWHPATWSVPTALSYQCSNFCSSGTAAGLCMT